MSSAIILYDQYNEAADPFWDISIHEIIYGVEMPERPIEEFVGPPAPGPFARFLHD